MTAPVPPVDLDQLETALAAATPGPWQVDSDGEDLAVTALTARGLPGSWQSTHRIYTVDVGEYSGEEEHESQQRAADAAAIVAAVNAAPALIAELRDLRAKQDAVRALAVRMRDQGKPYLNDFDRGLVAGYRDAADQIDRALDGCS